MKRFVLLKTVIICSYGLLAGQNIREDKGVKESLTLVQAWLDAQRAYEEIPGLSAAVVYDQELIWSGGYGNANPATDLPTTSETIHSICSISKLFTSISIMQLKEQGKLRLDDPVGKHLPWFKDLAQQFENAPEVTIEGILTHSAGLPRESNHPYWSGEFNFPSKEEIVKGLTNQETLYEPWQYFQYSNLGLTLAGQIVEEVSGVKYEEYVQQNILTPLQLENTRPYMPEELHGTELAVGYSAMTREGIRKEVPFFEANGITPAAGFSSTSDDLASFASWQLSAYSGKDGNVLGRNTLREMYRIHYMDPNWRTSWGIGFNVRQMDKVTIVGHGGSCPGYRSQFMIDPENKIAIVVMANASGVNTGMFANEIYKIIAPAIKKASGKKDPEDEVKDQEKEEKDFSKYEGTYNGFPWWGENYICQMGDNLVLLGFPNDNPSEYAKLKHIEGNIFKRIRDDEKLGQTYEFIEGANGEISGVNVFSNFLPKLK